DLHGDRQIRQLLHRARPIRQMLEVAVKETLATDKNRLTAAELFASPYGASSASCISAFTEAGSISRTDIAAPASNAAITTQISVPSRLSASAIRCFTVAMK